MSTTTLGRVQADGEPAVPGLVLIVEDDAVVADVVARYLDEAGCATEVVADGALALARITRRRPALVILDLTLPGLDGLEVLRLLREGDETPVIVLTARTAESERLAGLGAGADDYVTKPFFPLELVARVRRVLHRTRSAVALPATLSVGPLELDTRTRRVTVRGEPVTLTVLEFELLAFLMRHPHEVFRRSVLLEQVWGYTFGDASTVTVHIRRLRTKIEADPQQPQLLRTVWGVGYSLEPTGT